MSSSNNNAIQMPTPPLTPKTISRFDSNPYPTTFVQADTSTFKQVVQMLAGSSDSIKQASQDPPPSSRNFNIPHHELTKEATRLQALREEEQKPQEQPHAQHLDAQFFSQSQQQQLSKLLTKKHA